MLFMVKDKSSLNVVIASFFLLFYIIYLVYDFNNQMTNDIKNFGLEKSLMVKTVEFDSVLLGGSNVAFSLSAQQLTNNTNHTWFNFGLSSEAFNDKNYWNYIDKTINKSKRSKVKLVIYSSASPLKKGLITSRELSIQNAWGEMPIGLLPKISLFYRLKFLFENEKSTIYKKPVNRGDLNFEKIDCPQNFTYMFERETNEVLLYQWSEYQYDNIKRLFPNAEIIFVLPSEYYGEDYNQELSNTMRNLFSEIVLSVSEGRAKFINQNIFPNKEIICNSMLHGNIKGREWRTNELIESLYSL